MLGCIVGNRDCMNDWPQFRLLAQPQMNCVGAIYSL